ncbi:MAG: glycosyltransferase family 1 protein [Desulfovibrio sp.]|nr:glycosyltransferase family 1 protein [Desulfovibrio sp.]MCA1987447.1 glycosyltransferase family 1 protein [Desulfovibrio sp.]
MRTFVFLPPLARGSGGLAVLRALVRTLHAAGHEAFGVLRETQEETADFPCLPWDQALPAPQDLWLVPEGWPNALAPGLHAGARCVVWVQNHGMLFSSLPEGVSWDRLPVHFLAISAPVARFIKDVLGQEAPILRPAVDGTVFFPSDAPRQGTAGELRIAWMPRKNKALGQQIQAALAHRLQKTPALRGRVVWEPVHGLDQQGVAQALRRSQLFLATGFPEGCPLPPLEAMASGCLVTGFAGHGGWDYLRQAWDDLPGPWFESHPGAPGNALVAPDGDVLAATLALEQALRWHAKGDARLAPALAAARDTAARYAPAVFDQTAVALWTRAAGGEVFC